MPRDAIWSKIFRTSKICVLAEDKRKIIGFCRVRGAFNTISWYVRREYRGKGLGLRLFMKMIDVARMENCSFLSASIGFGDFENIRTKRFHWKLGFKNVAHIGKQSIMILPLRRTTGNFAFFLVSALFSLFPHELLVKLIGWVYKSESYLPGDMKVD